MRKIVLFLLIFAVVGGAAFAFEILSYPPPVEGGNLMIDVGVGLTGYGVLYGKMTIPPLFANVEYALPVGVPISVGGFFAFYQFRNAWYSGADYGWENTFMTFGARGNWHWGFDISWLDFYTGVWLGYRVHTTRWYGESGYNYTKSDYSSFDLGVQVGAHFYFTKNVGLVIESGWPFLLKAGLALKF